MIKNRYKGFHVRVLNSQKNMHKNLMETLLISTNNNFANTDPI